MCIVAFAKKIDLIPEHTKYQAIDGVHEAEIDEFDNTIVKLKMKDVQNIEEGDGYYFLDTGSPNYVSFVEDVNKIDVYSEGRKIRFNKKFGAKGTNVNFVTVNKDRIFVRTYERGVENETLSCGTGVVASAICASLKRHTPRYGHSSLRGMPALTPVNAPPLKKGLHIPASTQSSAPPLKRELHTPASTQSSAPPLKRGIKPSRCIYEITTRGGNLKVRFDRKEENIFENIWLEGSAKFVFEGKIEIDDC